MNAESHEQSVGLQWHWNTKLLLFTLVFLPLTVSLGFWQLEREAEKRTILDQLQLRQQQQPSPLNQADFSVDQNYLPVTAKGQFETDRYFLLENRVRNGRPGYEVLVPFRVLGLKQPILVNRGWVVASQDRNVLPELSHPEQVVELTGYLYRSEVGGYSAGAEIWSDQWPERVISTDIAQLQQRFGEELLPYRLRLSVDSATALQTGWEIVTVSPEKHRGYAVQWFIMAAALIVLTLFASSNLSVWLKTKFTTRD